MRNFKRQNRPRKNTMVIGRQAVKDALLSGKPLDRIYLQQMLHGPQIEELRRLAEQHRVPINKVPVEKLNSFNVDNHEGCIAIISKIRYYDLQQVISYVVEKGESPLFVILDGITDIRNIGAIARTAYCCGVHALVIPDKGVGALNEDAIATSAGALEKLAVCRVSSLMKAVDELHLNGILVYASEMTAEELVQNVNMTVPCAIVMGSEEKGINPALMKICDNTFRIPMRGNFESLNVSVATGMILYEAGRQRG